jgi:hypothetical protein
MGDDDFYEVDLLRVLILLIVSWFILLFVVLCCTVSRLVNPSFPSIIKAPKAILILLVAHYRRKICFQQALIKNSLKILTTIKYFKYSI